MEPIDKKQLGLRDGDYLYKCGSINGVGKDYYDMLADSMETVEFEVEYPKEWQEDVWYPLQNYTDFLLDGKLQDEQVILDKENIVRFWLYQMCIRDRESSGSENRYGNELSGNSEYTKAMP